MTKRISFYGNRFVIVQSTHILPGSVLGTLDYAQDPMGQRVNYLYDQIKRVTKVYATADGKTYMNEYAYTGDYLTQVKHNTVSDTASDVIYYFAYDALGNPTTVKVGTQTLSTNVYTATGDKLLQRVEYGNGGKVHYSRDGFKRVTGVRFDAETADRYQYDFDATGQTARVKDNHLNRTTTYEYDSANRPMKTTQTDGNNWNLHTSVLSYDRSNNLSRFEEQVGYWRTKYGTDFLYDNENRPISLRYNGTVNRVDYGYDALGRLLSRNSVLNNTAFLTFYGYLPGGFGVNSTTPLISSITQPGHNLSYTYDDRGNIASVTYNGQTIRYVYDALGQLIRVNDGVVNETYTFEYDRGGNILNKKHYTPCTTGTLGTPDYAEEYLYEDANWKDKLTARVINGNRYAVISDAIGNITSYAGWTYNWQAGRQLASQTNSGGTVEYKYNADGLRVQKKKGNIVTDYTLSGKNIVHMTVTGSPTMHFYYDAQDRPAQVVYNGATYRYVHNLQGDIIAIVDAAGNTVVQYTYGAWGEKKGVTGPMAMTLGKHNPFRYRGYVYDEETWMYYLRSRYYFPELQRFIGADINLDFNDSLYNLFSYCENQPVDNIDTLGLSPELAGEFFRNASMADGPMFYGDIIGIGGWLAITSYYYGKRFINSVFPGNQSTTVIEITPYNTKVANGYKISHAFFASEHKKGARRSTKNKHEEGRARNRRDHGGEKGDKRRKPNPNKRTPSKIKRRIDRNFLLK